MLLRRFLQSGAWFALTLAAGPVVAQTTGVHAWLHGRVTDSSTGSPVGGASVRVGAARFVFTDPEGRFALGELPEDTLTVVVTAIGFAPHQFGLNLRHGGVHLDITLTPRPIELDSLTVHAKVDALANQQAISVMTPEEIARQRGQTLGETMKQMPGVAIIQYGPSIAKPIVRGLHSQRVKVLNDGVAQEGQQWGGEHAPEIDAFAANEIEVVRGAAGVLYGSDALGGVIRVEPRPLPVRGHLGGQVDINAFSNNRQGAASVRLEGADLPVPLVGPAAWAVQLTGRHAGDARTPGYWLPNTGFRETDWNAGLGVRRSWGTSEVRYSHFGTRLGIYSGSHFNNLTDLNNAMDNPVRSDEFSDRVRSPRQEVDHDKVTWATKVAVPRLAQVELTYAYQDNKRSEFDNHGPVALRGIPAFGLRLFTHSLDLRAHHAPIGPLAGTIGVSGIRQGNISPGKSFLIPQYRLYSGGVYGLEQVTAGAWTFSVGARYDYRWQHAYQYGDPVVISPDDSRDYDGWSGSVGLNWRFASGWSLSSTMGRMWRAPNVSERFSKGVHHGTAQFEIGDTSLVSERGITTDMTLRHIGSRLRFEVSGYQNSIDHYIYLRPRAPIETIRGAYPAYNYTQTDARLHGAELSALWTPIRWVSLYLSGSLVRGADREAGTSLYDMPADRLVAALRLYGASRPGVREPYVEIGSTLVRRQDRVPPVTIYRLPTAGYVLFQAEAGVGDVQVLGQRLEASLAVRNPFNTGYRDYLSRYKLFVDEPGRDIVLRLSVPFGDTR